MKEGKEVLRTRFRIDFANAERCQHVSESSPRTPRYNHESHVFLLPLLRAQVRWPPAQRMPSPYAGAAIGARWAPRRVRVGHLAGRVARSLVWRVQAPRRDSPVVSCDLRYKDSTMSNAIGLAHVARRLRVLASRKRSPPQCQRREQRNTWPRGRLSAICHYGRRMYTTGLRNRYLA